MITNKQIKEYQSNNPSLCWHCKGVILDNTLWIEIYYPLAYSPPYTNISEKLAYLRPFTLFFHPVCFKEIAGDDFIPESMSLV
jgi:hypothetical protein